MDLAADTERRAKQKLEEAVNLSHSARDKLEAIANVTKEKLNAAIQESEQRALEKQRQLQSAIEEAEVRAKEKLAQAVRDNPRPPRPFPPSLPASPPPRLPASSPS
jgi:hypothetical protein